MRHLQRKLGILTTLMAVVLCLSAVFVSFALAEGETKNTSWEKTGISFTLSQYGNGDPYKAEFKNMEAGIYRVETIGAEGTGATGDIRFSAIASWDDELAYFKKTLKASQTEYTTTLWVRLPEGDSSLDFYGRGHTITAIRLTKTADLPEDRTFFYNPNMDLMDAYAAANGVAGPKYFDPGLVAVKQADNSYLYYQANKSNLATYDSKVSYTEAEIENDERWQNCFISYDKSTGDRGFYSVPDAFKVYSGGRQAGTLLRADDRIRFVVTAPKAGIYTVYAPISAGLPEVASQITIKNRDLDKTTSPVEVHCDTKDNCVDSWQWANTYPVIAMQLELVAGENRLELVAAGGDRVSIGELAFVREHTFDSYSTDATQHWSACSDHTDCDVSIPKENHGTPIDDGDCTTAAACPICAYVLAPAKDAHAGGTATCTEKAKCATCQKEYGDFLPHKGGTATCAKKANCDACGQPYGNLLPHTGGNTTCTDFANCSVCGMEYGDLAPHSFTVAEKDATDHWKKCANCDAIEEKIAHTGGTATCTQKKTCTECGGEYGDLLAHEFTAYKALDDGHVKKCASCDATDDATKADHAYGEDKKCVCGAEKTGCGASIAASAIAVTAVLGLGIGFIRKKKED